MTPARKKPGRPRADAARKLVVITVRLSPAQAAKWRRMPHAAARFRDWIERQAEPEQAPQDQPTKEIKV